MLHLPPLIQDLGVILITAALVTLLCKWLKQPVVLGYLIAGLLVGPHVPFLPSVYDVESIKVWAELGVIFLLFGLGLEFSFKKLAQVGKTASITAVVEVIFMLAIGYGCGRLLGWSPMDSLFLGGILSISSTTIIVRAFSELGLRGRRFVNLVFGILVVEDVVAILLLVLLATISATRALAGAELMFSGLRLGFFLALWFAIGIYVIPTFLHRIRAHLADEMVLIFSVGLCLLMVIVATKAGFSPALGAFVMGSILAETREGKRIEHLISPVRELFGAVFFVSVGMLIDPAVLREHFGTIALVTFVTIFGKFFSSTLGALLSGETLKTSVQTGMSLAQIGEFSFIIATLGLTLKVTSDFLYPIAVSVSAITTFTTPFLIRASDPLARALTKYLPDRMQNALLGYQSAVGHRGGRGFLGVMARAYGPRLLLNSVIILAATIGARELVRDALLNHGTAEWVAHAGAGVLALFVSAPFFWAILRGAAPRDPDPVALTIIARSQQGFFAFRLFLAACLTGFLVAQFAVNALVALGLLAIAGVILLNLGRSGALYLAVEERFVANLSENKVEGESELPVLTPWEASMAEFHLSPFSELVARSLQESKLKERFGVTLALIERGHRKIPAPGRADLLLPHDRLYFIGSDEQLASVQEVVERGEETGPHHLQIENYGLEPLRLGRDSAFVNKSIRECGIREQIQGLIVGVERGGERILSPDSSLVLLPNDLIWLVGDRTRIRGLREDPSETRTAGS